MAKETAQLTERPPIVVVMGHVDHGKSTLLDFIRKSNVVATEHGGITQHVAAYEVSHKDKRVTFIDTPGHAAFSAIRARGANVADIAILVVAADDGVKAQTLEALGQIRESGIPFIVAINKIDKPNANIERTQGTLAEHQVYLEKLGGDVPWTAISAKNGTGVDELLDLILLVAEIQEYKADASGAAEGYVIEAHRDPRRGVAATLIITSGTLESGMAVLAGRAVSPVRIMEDHTGKGLKSATFSTPVLLVGFDELPSVGEEFVSFKNKKEAEAARAEAVQSAPPAPEISASAFHMPVIIRADVTGSLEAIIQETLKLGDEHARPSIVQSGIGAITEGDVKTALAGENHAVIIGFNVGIDPIAEALARERGVKVETFSIIYKLTEKLEELLKSAAPKRTVDEIVGKAKVLKVFSSRKVEHVIGGKVTEGVLERGTEVRIVRRGVTVGAGRVHNIQTNKQNTERAGIETEFGAQLESESEPMPGDVLECFVTKTV
jgi:translation initiation factor IF-2